MAKVPIQSTSVPFELLIGGIWKPVVCLSGWTVPLSTTNTQVDTQCGRFYGLGPVGGAPTVSCVCTVDADPVEVTYRDLLALQLAQTAVTFRTHYPGSGSTGRSFAIQGSVVVLDTTLTDETNNPIKFTATFGIQGTIDNTPQ